MADIFSAILTLAMFGLLLEFHRRQRRDKREARARGSIRARVVSVEREEYRTRTSSWRVTTVYDVPGYGELTHYRSFEDEGKALLWSRVHRVDSQHDVYPNLRDPGRAFVREDMRDRGVVNVVMLTVMGALLAATAWQLAAAWLDE